MIKIYDRLWYITDTTREDNLSYMCQYETTPTGEVASNVKKMQETGRGWRKGGDKEGVIIDNTPTKNIYVGSSVSRWSTSNKLFRVTDPRGFTIEIPTDNLATLLHHTTVVKGYIQEECVWGKDGSNHILLPVNSEPYRLSKEKQAVLDNKLIPVKDLNVGDWVRFFEADEDYYFLGRVKITWKLVGYERHKYWGSHYKRNQEIKEITDYYEIEDKQYTNIFLKFSEWKGEQHIYARTPTNPKIVEVVRNEVVDVDIKDIGSLSAPDRVINRFCEKVGDIECRVVSEVVKVKYKGEGND